MLFFLMCQLYVLSIETLEAFKSSQKAKDMEIAFLQAQIAPHFIFNTLNNIYCLMDTSVPKARDLILDFCNFLRVKHKFDYRSNIFYTLNEEIELVKSYIKIENTRFQDAIKLEISVPSEYLQVSIPQLLIQPIIENSIKHGFCSNSLTIKVSAEKNKNYLNIRVSDNGKGMSPDTIVRILNTQKVLSGVGLKNINYRLNKCYNTYMMIESEIAKGTSISFEIPLEVQNECCDC
jgi:two-component system, LytTR family, sensor histidine kinase LytS